MLFAASAASFVFISAFVKTKKALSTLVFIVFGGVLLGFVIFLGLRLLFYATLTSSAIDFPIGSNKYLERNLTLGEYGTNVTYFGFHGSPMNTSIPSFPILNQTNGDNLAPLLRNLLLNSNVGFFNAFGGFFVSVCAGIFLAFAIFYSFGSHSFQKNHSRWLWFLYLVCPLLLISISSNIDAGLISISSRIDALIVSFVYYLGVLYSTYWLVKNPYCHLKRSLKDRIMNQSAPNE
jgi:hypothetical protein